MTCYSFTKWSMWNKNLPKHSVLCSAVSFFNKIKTSIQYEHWFHYKVIISGGLRWSLAPRLLFLWGPLTDHAEKTQFSAMCKSVLILHGRHAHTLGALGYTHIETAFTKTAIIQKQVWVPHSCWNHVFLGTDRPTDRELLNEAGKIQIAKNIAVNGQIRDGDSVCFGPLWISVFL